MGMDDFTDAAHVSPWPSITREMRPTVPTGQAAYYLHRKPQTLRKWAVYDGTGPVSPVRCNGRLMWPLDQIKAILGVKMQGVYA